jgi:uncharacterized membrane protein
MPLGQGAPNAENACSMKPKTTREREFHLLTGRRPSNWSMSDALAFGWVGLLLTIAWLAIFPGFPAIAAWLSTANAPAWVQAVGSVAAIMFAVVVFVAQGRRDERRRFEEYQLARSEQEGYAKTVVTLARRAVVDFEKVWLSWPRTQTWTYEAVQLIDAIDLLKEAATAPMYPDMRRALIDVRSALVVLKSTPEFPKDAARVEARVQFAKHRIQEALHSLRVVVVDPDEPEEPDGTT